MVKVTRQYMPINKSIRFLMGFVSARWISVLAILMLSTMILGINHENFALAATHPTISIKSPTSGATLSTGNQTVTGNASDISSGIKIVQVTVNGSPQITATPSSPNNWSSWSVVIPLTISGSNTITAKVIDNAGYTSSTSIPITVVDKTPPTIAITSPSSGGRFPAGNVTIAGTSSDIGSGVKTVQVSVNGSSLASAQPSTNGWSHWSITLFVPKSGSVTITAKATDNVGYTTSTSIPATVVDNTPPTVSITNPLSKSTISTGNLTLTGTSSDIGSGVKTVQVSVNGTIGWITATPSSPNNWSTWSTVIPITISGSNTITAKATDNVGYASGTSIPVTVVDKTPPTIAITSPTNGTTVTVGNVTMAGTSSDIGSGVKTIQISVNGGSTWITASQSPFNGWSVWNAIVFLPNVGSNTIIAKVTDNVGYTTNTSLTLNIVDKTPPVASLTYPSVGSTISAGNVTITGTASDIGTGVNTVLVGANATGNSITATPKSPGDWSTWSVNLLLSEPGKNVIQVSVMDNSNNKNYYSFTVMMTNKTARLSTSPLPSQFLFISIYNTPYLANLTTLYQKHARSADIVSEYGSPTIPSTMSSSLPSFKGSTFNSFADLKGNASLVHSQGYTWIGYDLEPQDTPAQELSNPVSYVQQAEQVAHSNGLKLLVTPALIPAKYWQGMAQNSDLYVLQAQYGINGTLSTALVTLQNTINLVRTANPNEIIILQGSTLVDTPGQIDAAYDSTKNIIDGITIYYNTQNSGDLNNIAKVLTHVDGKS